MDTQLQKGDFDTTSGGLPKTITGEEALLQRIRLRICCRKGSLPYLPELGSHWDSLTTGSASAEAILSCAAEGLEGLEGVTVSSSTVTEDSAVLTIETGYGSHTLQLPLTTWEEGRSSDGTTDI